MPSPQIASVASRLGGEQDWQKVCLAMRYVGENLAYDPAGNGEQFKRTARDLFRDETLDGCSDFALADMALFKAMGFPTRLVLSANLKWIERLRQNALASGNGHSFVEVFIDGRWHLADPTEFILYDCYDPSSQYLPGGEIFMARGKDFQSLAVFSVEDANNMLRRKAAAYQGGYIEPKLCERCAIGFDFQPPSPSWGGYSCKKAWIPWPCAFSTRPLRSTRTLLRPT